MTKILFLLLLGCGSAHAAEIPTSYYAPPQQTHAMLQTMDNGYANVTALFRNATGTFKFDDSGKTLSDLKIAVDTTSLIADNDITQRSFSTMIGSFAAPEMRILAPDAVTFNDGKAEVKANIILHGQSKPVTFEATLNKSGSSPHSTSMWSSEGQAVGITLHGTIKRADFNMAEDPAAPTRLGDTLALSLDLEGIKQ